MKENEYVCPKCGMNWELEIQSGLDPANEALLSKVFAAPCEKALDGSCKYATKKCFEAVPYQPDMDRSLPARRWIDCSAWPMSLHMFFDKKSGRWVYLSEETRKKLDKLKLNPEESYDEVVRRLISNAYKKRGF